MRSLRLAPVVISLAVPATATAGAQPIVPRADASTDAGGAEVRSHAPPSAVGTPTSNAPRSAPGPALKERSSRARRANPASGALFVVVIVAAIGWYVMKKVRGY